MFMETKLYIAGLSKCADDDDIAGRGFRWLEMAKNSKNGLILLIHQIFLTTLHCVLT